MPYQERSSGGLPKVYDDDDTSHRRKTTKEDHRCFVVGKIFICILECIFDLVLMQYAESDRDANVHSNKATWLIYWTWFSLILYAVKIVISFREACGKDDEVTRCLSDASLLLSLWIGDVPKCCLNMLCVVEYKNVANMLKAIFVFVVKLTKRILSLEHHFYGCSECVSALYILGIIVETLFAVLAIGIYIWSKL